MNANMDGGTEDRLVAASLFDRPDSVYPDCTECDNNENASAVSARLRKIGSFLLNVPEKIYNGLFRAAISFQTEPMFFLKRTAQTTVILGELSPANEAIRYGALAFALSITDGGPLVGAMALGLTTLLVEGAAAVATAGLVTEEKSIKTLDWVNEKVEKALPGNAVMSRPVEFGVALCGGSAVVLAEKQRENPNMKLKESRRYGIFTAAWMSAYFAVEGAYIGYNNEDSIFSAKTIGATALALTATWAGARFAMRRVKNNEERPIDEY